MTILDTLPPLRTRGPVQVSAVPFDDPELYGRLLAAAPASGRCPVLLSGPVPTAPGPAPAEVGRRDVADVLARRFPTGCVYHPDCLAPFGTGFPGCAPATAGRALLRPDDVVAAAVDEAELVGGQHLALVPVSRPADVPAALGWSGMSRSWDGWDDVAAVAAVLRSWEDRFGAVLVRLGPATLELSVAAPPWERSECLAVAAEHFAFCDDTYRGNPGTLRDHANLLRGAPRWSFWWE